MGTIETVTAVCRFISSDDVEFAPDVKRYVARMDESKPVTRATSFGARLIATQADRIIRGDCDTNGSVWFC